MSTPVAWHGDTFYVGGRRDRTGFSFWIERPKGKMWRHINQPAAQGRSVEPEREIVALTSEDPEMRQVALASGLFQPTGRTLRYPYNDANEIWSLTPECLRAFGELPAQGRTEIGLSVAESVSPMLCAFLGLWVRSAVSRLTVLGAAVLGPAPQARSSEDRVLLGSFPDTVKEPARMFTPSEAPVANLVHTFSLHEGHAGWQRAAAAKGFKTAVQVSLPAVAGRTFDCILFGVQPAHSAAAAIAALNAWPDMRAALVADSPLTQRELECLQYTAAGYTAEECAQMIGCSEGNVRHHLSKAMKRLGAPNTVSTIQRAQLMGLL